MKEDGFAKNKLNVGRRGHVCGQGAKRESKPIFSTHTPLGCPAGRAASIRALCFDPCLSFVVLKGGKVFFQPGHKGCIPGAGSERG